MKATSFLQKYSGGVAARDGGSAPLPAPQGVTP